MSKMSQLHAELTEQAHELGYEDIGEAEQAGCGVDWENHKLISPQDMAHIEWIKKRDKLANELEHMAIGLMEMHHTDKSDLLYEVIDFIMKGEV